MKWVGTFALFAGLFAVTLGIAMDLGGVATRMHRWGRDYRAPRGVRYTSLRALRIRFAGFALLFLVLLGYAIAAATGLHVAPNNY
jgi:hypothetical protein